MIAVGAGFTHPHLSPHPKGWGYTNKARLRGL